MRVSSVVVVLLAAACGAERPAAVVRPLPPPTPSAKPAPAGAVDQQLFARAPAKIGPTLVALNRSTCAVLASGEVACWGELTHADYTLHEEERVDTSSAVLLDGVKNI